MNSPDFKVIDGKLVALVWSMEPGECPAKPGVQRVCHGCHWRVYDLNEKSISYGYSMGRGGSGAGSRLTAMDNAVAAARRHLKKVSCR